MLAPLIELAARHNTAIIGESHLTKAAGAQAQAMMRVTGSLAFVAAARAAYLVTSDPQDQTRRLFLPMKNNLGPDATGLAFRIEPATVQTPAGPMATSLILWQPEPVSVTADEVMAQAARPEETSALTEAMDWLREVLGDGAISAKDVTREAADAGISNRTLRRAADEVGVTRAKSGMRGGWTWSLPAPKVAKPPEDVQAKTSDTFGNLGHLREAKPQAEVEI
jgi:hypothetical protein